MGKFMPIPAFTNLTLGLVGFGRIGRLVAAKSKAFGFHVVAYDPLAPDSCFAENGVTRVRLEELFQKADIISLHCPMVPETRHLINKKTIAQFKPGVLIVNTSRGLLINEADLVAGLTSGKIIGAGLDVFEKEPLAADSPLRALSNVILTSHAASVSDKAIVLLETKAAEAARDFLLGKRPASVIVDVELKGGKG